ncbi:hypothetical protein BCR44DRAFT_1463946 [Catenaria anguillulae PL171]|uniref:Uncharacterized protein n=1 Tax=Catenaria anguillulae PL171 TaxID=765915 RepID=A0A1Y2H9Q6_9FUNG|nr:hypothetical protein BCR44DRAFT_1463946 [Catenaria anguillulae PL171]
MASAYAAEWADRVMVRARTGYMPFFLPCQPRTWSLPACWTLPVPKWIATEPRRFPKLAPWYFGPYVVAQKVGADVCLLRTVVGRHIFRNSLACIFDIDMTFQCTRGAVHMVKTPLAKTYLQSGPVTGKPQLKAYIDQLSSDKDLTTMMVSVSHNAFKDGRKDIKAAVLCSLLFPFI